MAEALRDMNFLFVLTFVDDVIIFSTNFQQHISHIKQVLSALAKANLRLKPSKCYFAQNEVTYLGHTLSKHGVP